MALQLCGVSRSLEMCIEIRLRLEYRPVNHLATQLHNSSSKTHSLACSRWCVSYRVVCDPKIKSGRRMTHTAVRKPTLCTQDACSRAYNPFPHAPSGDATPFVMESSAWCMRSICMGSSAVCPRSRSTESIASRERGGSAVASWPARVIAGTSSCARMSASLIDAIPSS